MTTEQLKAAIIAEIEKKHGANPPWKVLNMIANRVGMAAATLSDLIAGKPVHPSTVVQLAYAAAIKLDEIQTLSAELAIFRKEHKILQRDFAKIAKVEAALVSQIECGYGCSKKVRDKVCAAMKTIEAESNAKTKKPEPVTLFEAAKPEPRWDFGVLGALDDELSGPNNAAPVDIKPVPSANPYKAALLRLADLLEETGAKVVRGATDIKVQFGFVAIETGEFELTAANVRRVAEQIKD